jgi:hypothetical protein
MALTIRAMRNNLGTSESPYYALASWSELVDCDAFINRMAAGRTTLSKTDILAVFQLAREELGRLLADGCYVKTPLGSAIPIAKGRLASPTEAFRPGRRGSDHELRVDFRIDPGIEAEALAAIECVRDSGPDRRAPRLLEIRSIPSDCADEAAGGGLVRVAGSRLKFDTSDERLGLFFRDEAGRETRAAVYAEARPSFIIAVVPASLEAGSYRLFVRTLTKGRAILQSDVSRLRIVGSE